ncbi:MAG: hypothetical protein E6Q97_11015 [Desulfurellales bacterium]|nr:MAG: hypothetical protein E6Q97_11015 [Desulfurellales bacterium]
MRAKFVLKWVVVFLAPFVRDFPSQFTLSDYIVCVLSVLLIFKFVEFLFFVANRIVSLSHRLTA